jgi:hypothetical protein
MVELLLKLPRKQNVVWMPKLVVDSLGRELRLVPGSVVAVLYSNRAKIQDVLESLRIIIQDLELRTRLETENGGQG